MNMTIDSIDWHIDSIEDENISDDELFEIAGAHIGYYLERAYKKGFVPSDPDVIEPEEYQKVINSEVSGIEFLIEECDSKFWDSDLNEEGQKFTAFVYEKYLNDLEMILGHEPYSEKYNQRDLQNVFKYLDKAYTDYIANPPIEPIKEEKLSIFQKLKNMFSKNK